MNGESVFVPGKRGRISKAEKERMVKSGTRECSVCKNTLPLNAFKKFGCLCKTCAYKRRREQLLSNPAMMARDAESRRKHHLSKQYGLKEEELSDLVEAQGGLCAICGKELSNFVVDHCHQTNVMRGLLCRLCNTGIGALGDNIEGLERAIKYLKSPPINLSIAAKKSPC